MLARTALLALVSTFLSAAYLHGSEASPPDVVVRLYDAGGFLTGGRRQALDVARSVLAATVTVTWQPCLASACDALPGPRDLVLRIVRWPAPIHTGSWVLGEALIDRQANVGLMATVYGDRVRWFAARSQVVEHTLLGQVVAHEIGHLLLASGAHSAAGLMRPIVAPQDVRRRRSADWAFTPAEAITISQRYDPSGHPRLVSNDAPDNP